ncbi:MAG: SGNH/GDSL hydrolase family protein [Vicinamibacterales bacterium]|nr:SGNH/GDSL hydrolase family protein [Vicinamibacterales bacterium]
MTREPLTICRTHAAFATLVCALLVGAGCSRAVDSPTGPSPGDTVGYSAIGASDGIGFGGTVPCVPFTECPNGTGYVQRLGRRLQERGSVSLLNLSIPAAVLSPTIEAMGRDLGRTVPANFLERQAPFVATGASVVTIFAGGNDSNILALSVRAGAGGGDVRGYLDAQIRQWGDDYVTLVRRIRERAPNVRIVVLNLPNLAGAPYAVGESAANRSVLQYISVGLTDRTNALTAQNVVVVDLLCRSDIYSAANFSSDGFHPNDAGYALMAEALWPYLLTGNAPPPPASCAARTLAPAF